MAKYKEMYFRLFNRITDVIREMEAGKFEKACEILKEAQLETEEMYVSKENA